MVRVRLLDDGTIRLHADSSETKNTYRLYGGGLNGCDGDAWVAGMSPIKSTLDRFRVDCETWVAEWEQIQRVRETRPKKAITPRSARNRFLPLNVIRKIQRSGQRIDTGE